MTRAPVLFRVDAGPRTGWESMWRCLTYAAALQRRRRPAYFLSQLEPESLAPVVRRGGNEWLEADAAAGSDEDLQELIQEIRRVRPAAVVLDFPDLSERYVNTVRDTGAAVVAFDSHAATAFPAQLVVNTLLGPTREAYEVRRGTQVLLGARFAIIRPEIRRIRPIRSQEPAQPFRALVALGDDDLNNQSGDLARYLLNCPRVGRVDVLVRPYHAQLAELQAMAAANPERLEIVCEPSEIPLRVSRCHMAVTAGNSWSLELACVGVPQLIAVQSEVYWPTAHRLEEEGAATCLGWHASLSVGTVRQAASDLLSDPLERQSMARCGRKLIDGRGLDRLVTALEIVLHPMRLLSQQSLAA